VRNGRRRAIFAAPTFPVYRHPRRLVRTVHPLLFSLCVLAARVPRGAHPVPVVGVERKLGRLTERRLGASSERSTMWSSRPTAHGGIYRHHARSPRPRLLAAVGPWTCDSQSRPGSATTTPWPTRRGGRTTGRWLSFTGTDGKQGGLWGGAPERIGSHVPRPGHRIELAAAGAGDKHQLVARRQADRVRVGEPGAPRRRTPPAIRL